MSLNSEILSIVDALSIEKSISKNIIIEAIEDAFTKIASNYYNIPNVISKMNLKNGEIEFYQKKIDPKAENDGFVLISLPQLPIQHLPMQAMRNNIIDKIHSAEKQIEYEEFKKHEGEIVVGIVKKTSNISTIVSLGKKTEAILFHENLIKTDNYKAGDKIKAYVKEVKRSDKDCQVILSRTDNNFLAMLIAESVVEVQDGMIDIKAISRSCGFKAKVAVTSSDGRLDAVGACIGARGSRIKPIVDELRGEKVDIIYYDHDIVNFAKNAITPAKAIYGTYDESNESIELVIPDDQLKLAIGKAGINVRLASQIVGCNISVIAESEKKKLNQEKFANNIKTMTDALGVDTAVAQFLVSSNVCTPSDLIDLGNEKLVKSGVFDEKVANELIDRAKLFVEQKTKEKLDEIKKLNVDKKVLNLDGITLEMVVLLAQQNIKTVKDIADLSVDEFLEICPEENLHKVSDIIMKARKIAYNIDLNEEENN